jgi:NADPH2:quinone reductase
MQRLVSTLTGDGKLELSLALDDKPRPSDDEVLIRVEAAPINPSDLGAIFGAADWSTAKAVGTAEDPRVVADIPADLADPSAANVNRPIPLGIEGAGIVEEAGTSAAASVPVGATVALMGGGMYAQYRVAKADQCLVMPDGVTPVEAASCFVNPLTVLGMIETMRMEGHTALVHTAAASNLGQMLNRLCQQEGISLVNIVRRREHVDLLKGLGAEHVCDSSSAGFAEDLVRALVETKATLAFDATGGGTLAGQILAAMETAQVRLGRDIGPYGSSTHKQVYIYGGLDRSPTQIERSFGLAWGIGGWLMPWFLAKIGPEASARLRQKVAAEIKTTFASTYSNEISLREALDLDVIAAYGEKATGKKYLIRPQK